MSAISVGRARLGRSHLALPITHAGHVDQRTLKKRMLKRISLEILLNILEPLSALEIWLRSTLLLALNSAFVPMAAVIHSSVALIAQNMKNLINRIHKRACVVLICHCFLSSVRLRHSFLALMTLKTQKACQGSPVESEMFLFLHNSLWRLFDGPKQKRRINPKKERIILITSKKIHLQSFCRE